MILTLLSDDISSCVNKKKNSFSASEQKYIFTSVFIFFFFCLFKAGDQFQGMGWERPRKLYHNISPKVSGRE